MDSVALFQPEPHSIMRLRPFWASIAQDIVLSSMPGADGTGAMVTPDDICRAYKMTRAECLELMRLPAFIQQVKDYRKRVEAMGDNASFTLRAQMLAADLMERCYVDVIKDDAEIKDRIKVMERLAQYGQLDPSTNGQNKQKGEGSGNAAAISQVIINVPAGIPGLEHIQAAAVMVEDGRGD